MIADLSGVQHHRTIVDGLRMHYAEAGSGPPVILLHGFPETWYAWRYQIAPLSKRYRLIVPDLRGCLGRTGCLVLSVPERAASLAGAGAGT